MQSNRRAVLFLCDTLLGNADPNRLHAYAVQGIKNVPNKLRIVIQRKRNEDDEDSVGLQLAEIWQC
jgi:hypothetical protein